MVGSFIFAIAIAYLLGSIPSAYIAGRLIKGEDIRTLGDGNMGTANAFRELGARAGIAVGAVDIGKGVAAMLIAGAMGLSEPLLLVAGLAAVAGHNWPLFLHFRGGRGEATTIGTLLALLPQGMLIVLGVAALPLLLTRNMIVFSAFIFIPLPLVAWWLGASALVIAYCIAAPCLVGVTHFITTRQLQAKAQP
ncbi:MAG: glycerol-3-phosphate acyltransferase [Chloroflexota bacterium]|nr:glycerol-3-phosphate acyltransferase [Chloroflexota bacterium]